MSLGGVFKTINKEGYSRHREKSANALIETDINQDKKASPSPRNKTINCTTKERERYISKINKLSLIKRNNIHNTIFNADFLKVSTKLPTRFADLLFLDPPYNLSKRYNASNFLEKSHHEYATWFSSMIKLVKPTLKQHASIYVCADWRTSIIVAPILEKNFIIQNRITWERGKGRGAKRNWKNNMEDIWFCTNSNNWYFNVDAVKLKKKVIAPYREGGVPKDWRLSNEGAYRMTCPPNIWTDISIPFWSMAENTNHPTQKPEKLVAKIVLASSAKGDVVFDPFLGSGTTAVVASKLDRKYVGIEIDTEYCCWALKRLEMAQKEKTIQGYHNGVFLERNSLV